MAFTRTVSRDHDRLALRARTGLSNDGAEEYLSGRVPSRGADKRILDGSGGTRTPKEPDRDPRPPKTHEPTPDGDDGTPGKGKKDKPEKPERGPRTPRTGGTTTRGGGDGLGEMPTRAAA